MSWRKPSQGDRSNLIKTLAGSLCLSNARSQLAGAIAGGSRLTAGVLTRAGCEIYGTGCNPFTDTKGKVQTRKWR